MRQQKSLAIEGLPRWAEEGREGEADSRRPSHSQPHGQLKGLTLRLISAVAFTMKRSNRLGLLFSRGSQPIVLFHRARRLQSRKKSVAFTHRCDSNHERKIMEQADESV